MKNFLRKTLKIDKGLEKQSSSNDTGIMSKRAGHVFLSLLLLSPILCLILINGATIGYLETYNFHLWLSDWYPFISGFSKDNVEAPEKYRIVYSWTIVYSLISGTLCFLITPIRAYFQHFLPLARLQIFLFLWH